MRIKSRNYQEAKCSEVVFWSRSLIVSATAGLSAVKTGGKGCNEYHKQGIEDVVNRKNVGLCFTMKHKVAILTLIDKRFGSE